MNGKKIGGWIVRDGIAAVDGIVFFITKYSSHGSGI